MIEQQKIPFRTKARISERLVTAPSHSNEADNPISRVDAEKASNKLRMLHSQKANEEGSMM